MTASSTWTHLIRFRPAGDEARTVLYGQPTTIPEDGDYDKLVASGQLEAKVIDFDMTVGPLGDGATVTDEVVKVGRLLGPLGPDDVTGIKCIGLNYRKHILEAGRSLPPYPSLFIKPNTCLADHGDAVPIPSIAQSPLEADYEGELCVVIGKDCKNVSKEDALSYVAGYTCGDDVSTRKWQRDADRAGGVPQWCFSKGFDKFAPLGPVLVSPAVVADPAALHMTVKINGQVRQDTPIADLVFDVPTLISFLSTGTTLKKGTVIMTGTPGGVGCTGPEEKWKPLKDGDAVEVAIPSIGILRHSIVYE